MDNLKKGKTLFLGMVIVLLGISLISTLVSCLSEGITALLPGLIRTGIEGALLYFVYKGKKWAGIIMIVLFTIAIILMLYIVISFSADILAITAILIYGGSIYILAFSPSVKEYLKSVN